MNINLEKISELKGTFVIFLTIDLKTTVSATLFLTLTGTFNYI